MGLGSTNTQRRTTTTKRWTLFALIVVKQSMRSVIARSLEIKLKLTRAWLSTVRRRTVAADFATMALAVEAVEDTALVAEAVVVVDIIGRVSPNRRRERVLVQ
jgi:hypothetical protein